MSTLVKICGLKDVARAKDAVRLGADFLGFIFFPKSPRHLSVEAWAELAASLPDATPRVGVFVDADDRVLQSYLEAGRLNWLQLHGNETPERVRAVQQRFGLPVMKAISVRDAADLDPLGRFADVAQRILLDAKPPSDGRSLPGGNGLSFDWQLIEQRLMQFDWALAGELNAKNIGEALRRTNAPMVDVSSGVETAPGEKDKAKLEAFFAALEDFGKE